MRPNSGPGTLKSEIRARLGFLRMMQARGSRFYMGVSENRGSKYSTLNSRVLIIRTPK